MEALSLESLDRDAFDAAILRTDGIDHFCSSTAWTVSAAEALMPPPHTPWIRRGQHGFAAFLRFPHPEGFTMLHPLEAMWCLASPLAGPAALAAEFADALRADDRDHVILLPGLARESPLLAALIPLLAPRYDLRLGEPTVRCLATLRSPEHSDSIIVPTDSPQSPDATHSVDSKATESLLARRTPNFRRSLRRALRDTELAGIRVIPFSVEPATAAAAYERILAIESRSWKGLEGSGLADERMRDFYRRMLPRLAEKNAARLFFAQKDERDIGYILGGVFGKTYRGLQFSFDDEFERLSLGSVLQWFQITSALAESLHTYDLGTDREYKRRWSDTLFTTESFYFIRR